MQQLLDLDRAAEALLQWSERWQAAGLTVAALTWADGQTTVHRPVTDRSLVRGDYSVAVTVNSKDGDVWGQLVVYAGGWCDLMAVRLSDQLGVDESPGADAPLDLAGLSAVLDRFEDLLLATPQDGEDREAGAT